MGESNCYKIMTDGYWQNKENCRIEALKYTKRSEFIKFSGGAAKSSMRNGWYDEITSHMTKHYCYWTYDRCKETALACSYKDELYKNYKGCYAKIGKNKWYELLSHLKIKSNIAIRYIYAFEFEDNHVYVGLTWNINKRYYDHTSVFHNQEFTSPVYIHINNVCSNFNFIVLTPNGISHTESENSEKYYIKHYKENGWILLNKTNGGGLGGAKEVWTYNKCKEISLKYQYRKDLKSDYPGCYQKIGKRKWYELYDHMLSDRIYKEHWTYEQCKIDALKCDGRSDFYHRFRGGYELSIENGWIKEFFPYYNDVKSYGYWNYENCKKESLKYKTRNDFSMGCRSAYTTSHDNKWMDEFFPDTKKSKPAGYWHDYDKCKEEASKYKTRHEFTLKCPGAQDSSVRNGWINDFFPK